MKNILIICFIILSQTGISQNSTNELNVLSENANSPVVSGFYNRINIGMLGGSNFSPSFQVINGYSINEHWSVGLGIGMESFFGRGYIPAFLEGNYNLLKSKTSPWVNVMAGYQLPFENIQFNKGGLTLGSKIGFTYFPIKHFGISTSVGYRYTNLKDTFNWWQWEDFVTISSLNRYEFRIGLVFK